MPKRAARELHYWRVIIVYSDNETSGNRVFKDRAKAEQWAARQEKSKVVKKARIEPFIVRPYDRRETRESC